MNDLSKANYNKDIDVLYSVYIREYDIKQANINILKCLDMISDEEYDKLRKLAKIDRQVYIGKKIRNDKEMSKKLSKGIIECRESFLNINGIDESDILSIKNDAVFIISKTPNILKVNEYVEFVCKNVYTSFMRINRLEIFYNSDMITGKEKIDVKGINDDKLPLHMNGLLYFIMQVMFYLEQGDLISCIKYINDYRNKYVRRELNIECYREFSPDSLYRVNTNSNNNTYGLSYVEDRDIGILDITYNARIIQQVYSTISKIYFNGIKKLSQR